MRSTSGITCCHFFCSAVFSIPVCRYPIVGAADSTVSPSSSSTRRSTPCVLGCWGPMLTVIVSVRIAEVVILEGALRKFPSVSFGKSLLDQIANHMQQRSVDLLDARGRIGRHVDVDVGRTSGGAAVPAGQRDRLQPAPARRFEGGDDIRRSTARRDA